MATWLWPNGTTDRPRINSPWNPNRWHPVYHRLMPHRGVDLYMPGGINRSITDGRVTKVGVVPSWEGGGYGVWVRNTNGSLAKYFHGINGSAYVVVGQRVKAGQALSRTGETGAATGVHLHLEISPAGGAGGQVDPVPYIQARINSTAGGGSTPFEEDDMSAEAERQIDAIYKGIFGPNNGPSAARSPLKWLNIGGGAESANYGVLSIIIEDQRRAAVQAGQISALAKLVQQLSPAGGGTIDMAAITAAAEKGAREALNDLTLKAQIDE